MKVDVKFDDYTEDILKNLEKMIPIVLADMGTTAERNAKKTCPVDTGRLRNSITYATASFSGVGTYSDDVGNSFSDGASKGTPSDKEVIIGTNVEYGQEIELHTHFLRDAVANHEEEFKALAKKWLG